MDTKEHGKQTYYYENGRKKREYSKINGKYDGIVLFFYETESYEKEQLRSKMFYSNGKKEGTQREYYKNGQFTI